MNPMITKVVMVTDPMCSWCWGMATDFENARRKLKETVPFDLMLGGINVHGTQPIGDYGRRFLMRLWREVADTTGQEFGFELPDEYVHNSVLPCLAVEAARDAGIDAAFELLHKLQYRFFVQGRDITDADLLVEEAQTVGIAPDVLRERSADPAYLARVRFQFDNAKQFGTQALPSLLVEKDGALQLLAGGYVDAPMLEELLAG
jgi:putative protein-disulfide isomerase